MTEIQMTQTTYVHCGLGHLKLGLRICLEFSASRLGFPHMGSGVNLLTFARPPPFPVAGFQGCSVARLTTCNWLRSAGSGATCNGGRQSAHPLSYSLRLREGQAPPSRGRRSCERRRAGRPCPCKCWVTADWALVVRRGPEPEDIRAKHF